MRTALTVALVLAAQLIMIGCVCLVIVTPAVCSLAIGPAMFFGMAATLRTIGEVWKPEAL